MARRLDLTKLCKAGDKSRNTRHYVGCKITKFYAACYVIGRGRFSVNVCTQGTDTYVDMQVAFKMIALLKEKIFSSWRTILRREVLRLSVGLKLAQQATLGKNLSRTASKLKM